MQLEQLAGRQVVLLGFGIDVEAALPAIQAVGPQSVTLVDESPTVSERSGLPVMPLPDAADRAEVFVRSPGFPRYQAPLISALARGAQMTTPVDLWFGTSAADQRVVAVTGTKGKSTTAHLIAELGVAAGLRIGLAGNLGVPVFSSDWDRSAPVIVIEVSSYQAADLHHVPDIAVVTSLAEDHLDWHQGYPRYVADKLRVVLNDGGRAEHVVVAADEPAAVAATASMGARVVSIPPAPPGVPRHRFQNAVLAAEVVGLLGATRPGIDAITAAANRSLPGRLDAFEAHGILWVDDALASNPAAAAAGLAWARDLGHPTVALIGGADRGVDPGPLAREVGLWERGQLLAIALPISGANLAAQIGLTLAGEVPSMASAVDRARELLLGGGVVMFSPGAPTPAADGNWSTRSQAFRSAVAELGGAN